MIRKRFIAIAAAGLVLGGAGIAGAQVAPSHDGGPPDNANPQVITHNCGALTEDIVKTQNHPVMTNAMGFILVPGAPTVINVPDGQSRCLKLLFTAEAACGPSAAADFCYVQALVDGAPMDPDGAGFQSLVSEDGSANAHAYEWVKRVGDGNHVVTIERRVGNAATDFYLDDYTIDLEVHL
jgi:hypothetical protein